MHGTPKDSTIRRRFWVSYLDDNTVVSGHNYGYIGIVHDTGRDGPDQFKTLYFKLSHTGKGQFFQFSLLTILKQLIMSFMTSDT